MIKNFWFGLAIGAVVAIAAVFAVRFTSPPSTGNPTAAFLVHVFEQGGSCTAALVAPKKGDAKRGANVRWDRRIDCTGMRFESIEIKNFRKKGTAACEAGGGGSSTSPVDDIAEGPDGSKTTRVKANAEPGPYCYDVAVKITGNAGSRTIDADPEMDIVR